MRPAIKQFDAVVTERVQAIQLPGFGAVMWGATLIGHGVILGIGALILASLAYRDEQWDAAQAFVIAIVLMGVYNGSKFLFRRPRPDNAYAARHRSSSFPSGHAADSMAVLGLAGYIGATTLISPWWQLALVAGITAPLLIGVSRIYLGAHYPTDVLAGWLFALVGLTTTILFFHL